MNQELEERVDLLVHTLQDKGAQNVIALDVRTKCSFTDYIIIGVGTATRHNKSLAEAILEQASNHHLKVLGKEGLDSLTWVLIDLNDIIVHLFTIEKYAQYELDYFWKNKKIDQD